MGFVKSCVGGSASLLASPPDKRERMRATTLLKGVELSKKPESMKRHPNQPELRRFTQQELLAEARITEEQNLASLAQFLKLEAEKKTNKMTKVTHVNFEPLYFLLLPCRMC